MKIAIIAGALALSTIGASAQTYTHGYTRSNGTYVAPHYSSSPDSTRLNNYSTQGNTNPYTGSTGTVSPYNAYGSTQNTGRSHSNGFGSTTNNGWGQ